MTSGPTDEELVAQLRDHWAESDPVPEGLVARMQAAAALAAGEERGEDLDVELMQLVERSTELAGTRGGASAYTLRFAHSGTDLLVRVAQDDDGPRLDCWVVPPIPVTVRLLLGSDAEGRPVEVGETGRFETADLPSGLIRIRLEPRDGSAPFITPAFEI